MSWNSLVVLEIEILDLLAAVPIQRRYYRTWLGLLQALPVVFPIIEQRACYSSLNP